MKSYRILRHSIRQVTGNPRAALILSLPVMIVFVAGLMIMPTIPVSSETGAIPTVNPGLFIFGLLAFVAPLLMAVNWHRHVLLEEPATLRPRAARTGVYVLRLFQIMLLLTVLFGTILLAFMAAIAILTGMNEEPAGLPVQPSDLSPLTILILAVGLILYVAFAVWIYAFMMRLSVMLPAAAIGKGIGVRQALARTRGTTGVMVMLTLFTGLLMIVLAIPMIVAQAAEWFVIATVLGVVLNWFLTLLSVSLLTTLYGHYVEGRALN